jgi:predicted nucleic acid-binding Zn ribbon protein
MAEKVSPHAHCMMCGKSIPVNETLCSEDCRQKYTSMAKRRRLMMYVWLFLIAALVVMILVGTVP